MMAMDMNLQVWLETLPHARPPIVVPHVQGSFDGPLHYELSAIRRGAEGTSQVRQSGDVQMRVGQPATLSQFSISAVPADDCRIDLTLYAQGQVAGRYQFDCPR